MADVDEKTKRSIRASIRKLVAFGESPDSEQTWNEAGTAVGALGDTAGRLLAGQPQEDTAFASSLTILVDSSETLRKKPSDQKRKDDFNIALGDIRYRLKRLFGVEWTCAEPVGCNARWDHSQDATRTRRTGRVDL